MTKAKVTFPSAPDTSAIDIKDEGSVIVSNPTALNFTGPGVTVTENPSGEAEVDIPGLQYWTESEDATTQQSTIFTPNNSATNVNAVIQPKGNGANTAQTPDGTNAGGDARGNYATDFQKQRSNSNEVAAGTGSGILAGRFNRAFNPYTAVVAGSQNTASTQGAFIGAGNSNNASGFNSAIVSGNSNTASGNRSAILGGSSNIASGSYSSAINQNNHSIGEFSFAGGYFSRAYLRGMESRASGFWTGAGGGTVSDGPAQTTKTVAFRRFEALSGGSANLSMDNTGTTNLYILLGNNRASNLTAQFVLSVIDISGTATGVTIGDYMTQTLTFGAKRVAGTCTVTSATILSTAGDASMTVTATITFTAGGSNEVVITVTAPTFAGGGTLTLGAACTLTSTEINTTI